MDAMTGTDRAGRLATVVMRSVVRRWPRDRQMTLVAAVAIMRDEVGVGTPIDATMADDVVSSLAERCLSRCLAASDAAP